MCRRTITLILLGLFVAQGVCSASAAPPSVHLPLVYGGPTVRVVGLHYWPEGLCAEIANETSGTVRIMDVIFYLLDDDGTIVGEVRSDPLRWPGTTIYAMPILGPGDRTVAHTGDRWWPGAESGIELPLFSSARAEVLWEPEYAQRALHLEVLDSELLPPQDDGTDAYAVRARVRNPLDVTLEPRQWGMAVTLYDAEGRLIGAADNYAYYSTRYSVLSPGAEATISVRFGDRALDPAATPVTYRVYAAGVF